jgi:hypothetical protein
MLFGLIWGNRQSLLEWVHLGDCFSVLMSLRKRGCHDEVFDCESFGVFDGS